MRKLVARIVLNVGENMVLQRFYSWVEFVLGGADSAMWKLVGLILLIGLNPTESLKLCVLSDYDMWF